MIHPAIPTLMALAAPVAAAGAADPTRQVVQYAQLTIQRVIVRVPRMPIATPLVTRTAPVTAWKERKGPKCIAATGFAGALVTQEGAVDLVMQGGRRIRAKLEGQCRQLDFYSGFYLKPAADGQVCADRDAISVRSGASCGIKTFKALEPKR